MTEYTTRDSAGGLTSRDVAYQDAPVTRKAARKAAATPRVPGKLETIPLWMQAIAALAGVVLTGLGVFGLAGGGGDDGGTPTPASSATSVDASVSLHTVTTDQGEVVGLGSFTGLDPATDAVLFIGQPAEGDADWLPVVATTTVASVNADGSQDGDWQATRPGVDGRFTWYAVVGPRVSGAEDPYGDLRANGPEADLIRAVSERFSTGE